MKPLRSHLLQLPVLPHRAGSLGDDVPHIVYHNTGSVHGRCVWRCHPNLLAAFLPQHLMYLRILIHESREASRKATLASQAATLITHRI